MSMLLVSQLLYIENLYHMVTVRKGLSEPLPQVFLTKTDKLFKSILRLRLFLLSSGTHLTNGSPVNPAEQLQIGLWLTT